MLGLANQIAAAAQKPDPLAARKAAGQQAQQDFLKFAKESPIERMEDAWLKAHGLDRNRLAAMPPEEREKILKQMQEDIKKEIERQAKAGTNVDIAV